MIITLAFVHMILLHDDASLLPFFKDVIGYFVRKILVQEIIEQEEATSADRRPETTNGREYVLQIMDVAFQLVHRERL